MTDEPKKIDFTQSINKLEDTNAWFQNEDFNLDEGLQKLKEGKELIKKCRTRLQEVENEFVKIKKEFAEEADDSEVPENQTTSDGVKNKGLNTEDLEPEDTPF
jgi:exodeoxyribonuclease VII small subunit